MIHHLHHVPGRLRLRVPAIKRNEHHARAVGSVLRETDGVLRHELSSITGSVVVHYAPGRLDPQQLINRLRELTPAAPATPGTALVPWQPVSAPRRPAVGERGLAQQIGKALATSLTEKLIERSALALVAALL
jgi:hypothetical protein